MRKFFLLFLTFVMLLTGCSAADPDDSGELQSGDTKAYVSACLEIAGLSPQKWEKSDTAFMAGTAYRLYLDDENERQIVAYEYPSAQEAGADAIWLHADGFGYSRQDGEETAAVQVEWIAAPHFYLYENLIIQYIGEEWIIIDALERNFGPQIAGVVLPREEQCDIIGMVMVDDKYYYDTGLVSTVLRCGNMDGYIDSAVESCEIPKVNGQSNFGAPYGYQYGSEEDTIEICINGEWIIFEHRSGDGSQVLINGEWVDADMEEVPWGLEMDIRFTSADAFEIVFTHDSRRTTEKGVLTTGPEYELRVVTESEAFGKESISFGDYMRGQGYDYADPELAWDAVLYTIAPDNETVIDGNLLCTYGSLPVGEYLICKDVHLETEDGEILTAVYTASFFVTE